MAATITRARSLPTRAAHPIRAGSQLYSRGARGAARTITVQFGRGPLGRTAAASACGDQRQRNGAEGDPRGRAQIHRRFLNTAAKRVALRVGPSMQPRGTRPTRLCQPKKSGPKCSLSKYGFRASGVRTRASVHRAETGFLPRFLSSVLKRPSQEVRRELASGERFSAVSAPGQSTGLPRIPQETCHSARRSVWRRVRLVWELAEEVRPDANGRCSATPIGTMCPARQGLRHSLWCRSLPDRLEPQPSLR